MELHFSSAITSRVEPDASLDRVLDETFVVLEYLADVETQVQSERKLCLEEERFGVSSI